ncbi:MAG: helix-turn-helix transcriptional regulator [Actinobacteria bacterium]|nr:helix-turn-helix transcriptional regulator [Actinomycetota bacterium]
MRIGAKLRRARTERGLTMSELAEQTGLTKGFLSLVERDRANASVANLVRICDELGLRIGSLFEPAQTSFVPKAQRPRINFGGERVDEYLLTPNGETRLQVIESIVEPGGGSGPDQYSLRGETELVHVISGRLDLTVRHETVRMKAGDSLTFSPRDPHAWTNPSTSRPTHVIWAVAPSSL